MRRPSFDVVVSALFLGLLLLPAARMPFVDAARQAQAFAERENRPPARIDLTAPTFAGLREDIREIEAWFADRYGFRNELIALATRLHLAAGMSPREDLVLLGRDGWLFLGNSHERVVDKTSGRLLFTPEQLEAYVADLEERRRWLTARGVAFMVFVAPEKHSVYPELLPAWARNATGRTMAGQLAERLRGGALDFADLTGALRSAREQSAQPLYYRNDTHWNGRGAFAGYRGMMAVVARRFPGARTLEEPPFKETTRPGGDLLAMLAAPGSPDAVHTPVFGDTFEPLELGGNCPQARQRPGGAARQGRGRGGDPMYLVVVPNECRAGQAALVTGSGLEGAPRVLVLGDSFATGLSPYLNQSFATVAYTHERNARTRRRLEQYVDRYDPDLVLLEVVERSLTPPEGRPAEAQSGLPE